MQLRALVPQRGVSLIELMISITLGMLIVAALLALYLNITRTNNEMAKTNRQIENGRFAIQVLQNDLLHAGYWGPLGYSMPPAPTMPAPTALPDPCVITGWDDAYKRNLLAVPVRGYPNGATLGGCGVASVLPDSDVLVVRRANTCEAGSAGCDGGTEGGPHLQVSACRSTVPPEAMYVIASATRPTLPIDSAKFPLREKDCATPAALRKVVTNIYYLANSNNVPTLMRVSLVDGAYTAPQPLIEGIEAFRVEYGIDTLARNGQPISATNPGDGSADTYISSNDLYTSADTLTLHANIVSAKVHVLARNLEPTPGYTDGKAYRLGGVTVPAANDPVKRHVFTTMVRLVNPSARREMP
jgi:type IV pilus assembly protein PilW